jgi:transmembrane sensor
MRRERTDRPSMPIPPQIIDDAAEWFVTMRDPPVSQGQRETFAHWLRASPVHLRAYLDIARMWGDASQVSADLDADDDPALSNVIALNAAERSDSALQAVARSARIDASNSRVIRPFMVAASILLVCSLAGAMIWQHINRLPVYAASIGEQRIITLDDGSTVRLNSRSKVRVSMTSALRSVELLEGQALFEVAKDPSRPFVVDSSDVSVRAVGTAFDVNRRSSGTVVTVVEGKVAVSPQRVDGEGPLERLRPGLNVSQPYALAAGEQAIVTRSGQIERRPDANVAAATSWLDRELAFEGQPLGIVVEEFNRYVRTPIVLSDPSLKDLRVNAVFHTTSPDSLLRFVSRIEGVAIERDEDEIRITRRVQAAPLTAPAVN